MTKGPYIYIFFICILYTFYFYKAKLKKYLKNTKDSDIYSSSGIVHVHLGYINIMIFLFLWIIIEACGSLKAVLTVFREHLTHLNSGF